jgi:hypothetical protein
MLAVGGAVWHGLLQPSVGRPVGVGSYPTSPPPTTGTELERDFPCSVNLLLFPPFTPAFRLQTLSIAATNSRCLALCFEAFSFCYCSLLSHCDAHFRW